FICGSLQNVYFHFHIMKELGKIVDVKDVNLNGPVSEEVVNLIKKEVHEHVLLIFKNQGLISGDRQVEISKWFGDLESTFYKHPRSPHPDVFRVSNNEEEGCTNVGRTGWHIDGSFMREPFKMSLYHMVAVPKRGDTAFVPLTDLIESLQPEVRDRWERLYMVSDRRSKSTHPLIYPHPVTKKPTLCFHLGMTDAFMWDAGTDKERMTDWPETKHILMEIHQEIEKGNRNLVYSHKWEQGDFIISDNLAVGHEASPETQFPVSEVGLRILHRTTVKGTNIPTKS
ncbi:alpha-ketoglutarate-dependent 2,4-dichlorophenoxyacetate dioxygenase-like, partial [Saccostrea cucullata]|uniref:alpha-ketoglutarate-dependent 2,4-dichlorophenoxyacetate dioxygenase-like n=1 Tax=Saccostrea cuccullata TaxID=36930 RepID=UPI002ED66FE7